MVGLLSENAVRRGVGRLRSGGGGLVRRVVSSGRDTTKELARRSVHRVLVVWGREPRTEGWSGKRRVP